MHAALRPLLTAALLAWGGAAAAQPTPTPPPTRGQLLYETHCIACHNTQMHWRDNSRVRDWAGLREQVRRWQGTVQLEWSDEDIEAVARYLNDIIYRLPLPERRAAR